MGGEKPRSSSTAHFPPPTRAPSVTSAPFPATPAPPFVTSAPHLRHPCAPHRHSCAPPPSFLRRQEPTLPPHLPPPQFIPPPSSKGEVRWGVRSRDRPPPLTFHPPPAPFPSPPLLFPPRPLPPFVTPAPHLRHSRAPPPSFLRRQEPAASSACTRPNTPTAHQSRTPSAKLNRAYCAGSCLRRNDGAVCASAAK